VTAAAIHASSAAVELTALTDPITAWMEVFGTTFNNISQIGGDIAAAPLPILQQVIANQVANGQLLFSSIDAAAMSYIRFFTSAEDYQGAYWFRQALDNLSTGNITGAAANLSNVVFRLFAFANPLINIIQIPIGISQNLVNAFTVVPEILMPLGLSVLNPIEGAINASGDIAQGVLDGIKAGDPAAVLGAIINGPALLAGAILNGYYNGVAAGTSGLFSTSTLMLNRGLIQTLLVTIPQMIATAIGWHAPAAASQLSEAVVEDAAAVETDAETASAETLPAVELNGVNSIPDANTAMTNAVNAITAAFHLPAEPTESTPATAPSEVDGTDDGEAGTVIEEEASETETPATDEADGTDETTGSTRSTDSDDSQKSNGTNPSTPNGSTDLSGGNKAEPGRTGSDTNAGSGSGSGSAATDESTSPTTGTTSGAGSPGNNADTGSSTNDSGNDAGGSNDGSDGGSDS
jgi:hypothetical protein